MVGHSEREVGKIWFKTTRPEVRPVARLLLDTGLHHRKTLVFVQLPNQLLPRATEVKTVTPQESGSLGREGLG